MLYPDRIDTKPDTTSAPQTPSTGDNIFKVILIVLATIIAAWIVFYLFVFLLIATAAMITVGTGLVPLLGVILFFGGVAGCLFLVKLYLKAVFG